MMIPKRIFFYWSGNNLSWMRYMTLYSFRKYNPEWEVVLYLSDNNNVIKTWSGEEEQDFSNYNGINYLDKVEELNIKIENIDFPNEINDIIKNISPVHESDLFRYYELNKNGGIYCDMDVLFFKSIDDFYNDIINNNIDTIIHQCSEHIAIGLLGSSINNEFYKDIFDSCIKNFNTSNYQSLGVDLIYNMFDGNRQNAYIIDKIKSKYKYLKFKNIPTSLIYNFDWTMIEYNYSNSISIDSFPNNSIGYHWFGGSQFSQYYNNILNENNYKNYNITFSEITKKINE